MCRSFVQWMHCVQSAHRWCCHHQSTQYKGPILKWGRAVSVWTAMTITTATETSLTHTLYVIQASTQYKKKCLNDRQLLCLIESNARSLLLSFSPSLLYFFPSLSICVSLTRCSLCFSKVTQRSSISRLSAKSNVWCLLNGKKFEQTFFSHSLCRFSTNKQITTTTIILNKWKQFRNSDTSHYSHAIAYYVFKSRLSFIFFLSFSCSSSLWVQVIGTVYATQSTIDTRTHTIYLWQDIPVCCTLLCVHIVNSPSLHCSFFYS